MIALALCIGVAAGVAGTFIVLSYLKRWNERQWREHEEYWDYGG